MIAADDMPDSDQSARGRQCPRYTPHWLLIAGLALGTSGCAQLDARPVPPAAPQAPAGTDAAPGQNAAEDIAAEDIAAQAEVPPLGEIEPSGETEPSGAAEVLQIAADVAIWERLRRGYRLQHRVHPRVDREIRRLRRSPNAFRELMTRAEPFLHYILGEVEEAGLPTELVLLPAVESGFRPHVYSPDGAAGLWQFMPATGRMMGLGQDWWFDRRRALRAATPAALSYLQRLNDRFAGDWLHTLAAYNAGARKVGRAIVQAKRRGEPTDFWSLDLPGETDAYVPRLLALAAVVGDPQAHGLDLPEIVDRPYFAVAATAGQIDLNVAARLADLEVDELVWLNAGHRRWASRPDGPHELLLPIEKIEGFEQAVVALPAEQRMRWQKHRIRQGDSLYRIAREYGATVDSIRRANSLRDSRIRAGRDLLIPLSDAATTLADRAPGLMGTRQRLYYHVREGDSLYAIARRFQVSIADLKRWNRVGRHIQPGEQLTVFIDPDV
jgi:membrane-bound lytic murein transglycosylase D